MTLRHWIALQAQTRPAAPCLLAPGYAVVTYADLLNVVSRTGRWLASNGLGAGSRVAVCLPQGLALSIAALSVSCHATVVALHPGFTEPELAVLLANARAHAVLGLPGDPIPRRLARQLGLKALALDLEQLLRRPSESNPCEVEPCAGPGPDATAFVLFTSGTTGEPKRVPHTHRQVLASARNIAQHLALAPDDRGLCLMPPFHSHGLVGGLLAPLIAGSSTVCTPAFDSAAFLSWFTEFTPTWYTASPTIHWAVADLVLQARGTPVTHKLRFIRSASSALAPELLQRLERLWGAPVIESYGMTESASQMASNPLPPAARKPGSVGLPAGAALRVIDDDGNPQPAGCIGSIVARGPALFSGYEDAPAANAQAFRNGWFFTGDQGWFDADGYLHVTGRKADMINRGGEKLAPFEVEQALLRLPAVVQAAAYPVPHPTLGEDIHAAVVLARGHDGDPHALRTALFGIIADFKIPTRIHVLDSIPTGVGGKLQRRRLHEQILRAATGASAAARGLTALEAQVARLFEDLLGHPVSGPDDNFLAMGGDSLSAARLTQRMCERWGVELSASAVLAAPTVGALAALLQADIDEADALARALQDRIDRLSDNDIARLLADTLPTMPWMPPPH